MILEWIAIVALLILITVFIVLTTPSTGQKTRITPIFPLGLTSILGRGKEIDQLKRLILTGQSSAIVGVFGTERTAILGYLSDPSQSQTLYGEYADKLVFSLLDISALPKDCSPADFWQRALKPLEEKCHKNQTLFKIYQTCQQNQFDEYCLDKLMVQLKQDGWRLILMLDRFDELLNSSLDKPEFFALLRRLASSRTPSSLSLIISGNLSLKQFHDRTKGLNPKGSPFLNFMENGEIVLGALSESKIDELLQQSGFSHAECQFIKEVAGQHPHFIRLAASAVQTAKEQQEEQPLEVAQREFSVRVAEMLTNIMRTWDAKVCQTLVALVKGNQQPSAGFLSELALLEKQGFLIRDADNSWQVSARALVDFINRKTEQELCS